MKIKWLGLILLASALLLASCAPRRPSAPLLTPTPPPDIQTDSEESLFLDAERLYSRKQYAAALKRYHALIALFPQGALADAALMKIADIQLGSNAYPKAQRAYKRLLAAHPQSPFKVDALLGLMEVYNRTGQYEASIALSFELPEDQLSTDQINQKYLQLANAYQGTGSPVDAFYFYSLLYQQTTGEFQKQVLDRLRHNLKTLTVVHVDRLLRRFQHPAIRGHLLYQMGVLNLEAGHTDHAIDVLSEIIFKHPQHEVADQALTLLETIYRDMLSSPYTIGCLLPLSGPYRIYGERALRGIELAFSHYYQSPAFNDIRLVIKDTAADPFKAVQAVRDLDQDHVAALIGPMVTAESAALEAQSRGIPIVTFTQKKRLADTGDFVFRNFITPQMQVQALIDFTIGSLGYSRFAILYPDENYGTTFLNLFWDEALRQQAEIVGVAAYDPQETDFAVPIQQLVGLYYEAPADIDIDFQLIPETTEDEHVIWPWPADTLFDHVWWQLSESDGLLPAEALEGPIDTDVTAKGPETPEPIVDFDAVFIPDSPKKAGLIIPQLAYFDVEKVTLLGTNLWHSKALMDMARKYVQGALVPDGFFVGSQSETASRFVNQFESAFQYKPAFIEAITFDSATLLFEVLRRPGIRFKSHIRDALLNTAEFEGVTGTTAFDYKGDAIKGMYLLQVYRNRFMERRRP